MARKKFFLGILVMVLVFGSLLTGCEPSDPTVGANDILYKNQSSFTLVVEVWKYNNIDVQLEFELTPGSEYLLKGVDLSYALIFTYWTKDPNDQERVVENHKIDIRTIFFYDA